MGNVNSPIIKKKISSSRIKSEFHIFKQSFNFNLLHTTVIFQSYFGRYGNADICENSHGQDDHARRGVVRLDRERETEDPRQGRFEHAAIIVFTVWAIILRVNVYITCKCLNRFFIFAFVVRSCKCLNRFFIFLSLSVQLSAIIG